MRCMIGVVLWLGLCYGGIQTLAVVGTANAKKAGLSQRAAQDAGWKVVEKYHAWVYVAAGLISIAACSIPSLLTKNSGFDEDEEWRRMERSHNSGRT